MHYEDDLYEPFSGQIVTAPAEQKEHVLELAGDGGVAARTGRPLHVYKHTAGMGRTGLPTTLLPCSALKSTGKRYHLPLVQRKKAYLT